MGPVRRIARRIVLLAASKLEMNRLIIFKPDITMAAQ
jgi:hypothetical protein